MAPKRLHGAHVPHHKNTVDCEPKRMPTPAVITVPMNMNIGAPAKPVVKAGDLVKVGQLIAEADGLVSSPIYSGVSGKVKKIDEMLSFNGKYTTAIVIESDGLQEVVEGLEPHEVIGPVGFLALVRDSGVVGLGGAGFPTAVKLSVGDKPVDVIIINGAECEPFITTDNRTMLDEAETLIEGIKLLQKHLSCERCIIGVEDNKPRAIAHLKEVIGNDSTIEVHALPALYPQGAEKVMIYHTVGRVVPEGKLPIDVGAVVMNCTSVVAVTKFIKTGMPLVEKCVTVDGSAIANPMNVIAPIGTPIKDIIEFTGGFKADPRKVVLGGPMMGMAVPDLDTPIQKNTSAILAFAEKEAVIPETTACIKCGRCIATCPLNLMPANIETAYKLGKGEELAELKVNLCMECGCCAFVCPAKRPLVQVNKLAKGMLWDYNAKLKAEAEKKKAKEEAKEEVKA